MNKARRQFAVLFILATFCAGMIAGCGDSRQPAEASRAPGVREFTVRVAPAAIGSISVTTSYAATVEARELVNLVP